MCPSGRVWPVARVCVYMLNIAVATRMREWGGGGGVLGHR